MRYDEQLIEKIKENEIIYNKSHKAYKNTILKERKWKEISGQLNISVETAKRRWRTIKDRYFRTKKAVASGNSSDRKPYRFALQLSFLDNCIKINEGTTNNTVSEDHVKECRSSGVGLNSCPTATTKSSITSRSNKRRLTYEPKINNARKELLKVVQEVAMESRRSTKEEIFCDLLAIQMIEAKLPPETFRAIQIKFLKVLDEEVQQLAKAPLYF